jgi:ribulose-phosphate 3-epimerase
MLKCSTSLWSADLGNLAHEMKRVEPYSERFHLDVADGHYVSALLFFPDLVRALRPHTRLPFEVHLMVTDPLAWVDPFVEAGADVIIFDLNSTADAGAVIRAIKARGKMAGLCLALRQSVQLLAPHWADLDIVTVAGTALGIKGASMDPAVLETLRQARRIIAQNGWKTLLEADGGIRRETVPLLKAAGADFIVPGSLMFKEDPKEMRRWLDAL